MHSRRFSAFISYRHTDNAQEGRRWAEWLHRALERYVVPPDLIGTPNDFGEPIRDSLYPLFRDEDELPANADLAAGIRAALQVSDYLIVLCSPRSAVSRWVRDEVRRFKELGRCDRILAVIIAGEPHAAAADKARDGVMADEECFCEELRFGAVGHDGKLDWQAPANPLAADFRPTGTRAEGFVTTDAYREHLTLNSSHSSERIACLVEGYRQRHEQALFKVISGVLGVTPGQLIDRDAAHRTALAEAEAAKQRQIAERERLLAKQAQEAAEVALNANEAANTANERLRANNRTLQVLTLLFLCLTGLALWLWGQANRSSDEARSWGEMTFTTLTSRLPEILGNEDYGTLNSLIGKLEKLKQTAPPETTKRINAVFEAVRNQFMAADFERASNFTQAVTHHRERIKWLNVVEEMNPDERPLLKRQIASALVAMASATALAMDFEASIDALDQALGHEQQLTSTEIPDFNRRFSHSRMCQSIGLKACSAGKSDLAEKAFAVEEMLLRLMISEGRPKAEEPMRLARAIENRSRCLGMIGRSEQSLRLHKECLSLLDGALSVEPSNPIKLETKARLLNQLAWSLATTYHEKLRMPIRALNLAKTACELTKRLKPDYLDTLAAAYADIGDFENAIKVQFEAIAKYTETSGSQKSPAAAIQHLETYHSRSPWRQRLPEGVE